MLATIASLLLSGVTVSLPEVAQVRGTEMSLGEIASVTGPSSAAVERVRNLSLGYAPAPGYSRLMQSWMIENRLRELLPGIEIQVEGKSACRITPLTERVAGEVIGATAESALRAIFAGREATITPNAPAAAVEIPAGDAPFELVAAIDTREVRAGLWSVPVRISVDGSSYQTSWTSWNVELFDLMPVLRRDVMAGERIEPEWVELRRTRISQAQTGRPLTETMIDGAVALRNLRQGTAITAKDVRRPEVLKKGDVVHLQVRKRSVTARIAATALQGGHIGDRIRVSVDSGRVMTAVVLSRDLVEVNLTESSHL